MSLQNRREETVQVSDLYLDKSFPNVSHKRNYLQYSFCQFTVGNHIGVRLVHLFSHHCYGYWVTLLGKEVGCFSVVLKLVAKQLGL